MSTVFSTPADETAGTDETAMQPSVSNGAIGALPGSTPMAQHIGNPSNSVAGSTPYALTETVVPA